MTNVLCFVTCYQRDGCFVNHDAVYSSGSASPHHVNLIRFLGFGLPAGSPSLGELLAQGKRTCKRLGLVFLPSSCFHWCLRYLSRWWSGTMPSTHINRSKDSYDFKYSSYFRVNSRGFNVSPVLTIDKLSVGFGRKDSIEQGRKTSRWGRRCSVYTCARWVVLKSVRRLTRF